MVIASGGMAIESLKNLRLGENCKMGYSAPPWALEI